MSNALVESVQKNLREAVIDAVTKSLSTVTVTVELPLSEAADFLVSNSNGVAPAKNKRGGGKGRPLAIVTAVKEAKGFDTKAAEKWIKDNPDTAEMYLAKRKKRKKEEKEASSAADTGTETNEESPENVDNEADSNAIENLANA